MLGDVGGLPECKVKTVVTHDQHRLSGAQLCVGSSWN